MMDNSMARSPSLYVLSICKVLICTLLFGSEKSCNFMINCLLSICWPHFLLCQPTWKLFLQKISTWIWNTDDDPISIATIAFYSQPWTKAVMSKTLISYSQKLPLTCHAHKLLSSCSTSTTTSIDVSAWDNDNSLIPKSDVSNRKFVSECRSTGLLLYKIVGTRGIE
jgi:hypothetical protein